MPFSEFSQDDRDEIVREILATSLDLAKELQRELGRLQQIVDTSLPHSGEDRDD